MKPKAVIAKIYLAGHRPSEIARELEVSRSAVSKVISGKGKSARIAKKIAKVTGHSVSELWPGRYLTASRRAA